MWVPSLGWEETLKKEMTTHSNILAWKIPQTKKFGGPRDRPRVWVAVGPRAGFPGGPAVFPVSLWSPDGARGPVPRLFFRGTFLLTSL